MSLARREKLLDLAEEYDFLVVEDAPYRQLCYEGEYLPLIYELAQERGSNRVILLGPCQRYLLLV